MKELTKGIPISIQLKTQIKQNEEVQDFLFDLEGQAVTIGDTLYIRYKEAQSEGEIPVTIKIMPDGIVQLTRAGEVRSRLKFAYREKLDTSYQTPYGMMFFSTYTNHLHVSLKDQPFSGRVDVLYDLYMQDEKIGEYQLSLDFTA